MILRTGKYRQEFAKDLKGRVNELVRNAFGLVKISSVNWIDEELYNNNYIFLGSSTKREKYFKKYFKEKIF